MYILLNASIIVHVNDITNITFFCQAQSQLQLSWTELALISTFPHPPPHPPGKVLWRTFQACGTIPNC